MRRASVGGKRAALADGLRPCARTAKIGGPFREADMSRRVAIVAGCRTPFARAGSALSRMSPVQLGTVAVRELINRAELDVDIVNGLVFGTVVPSILAPNVAR
jgi:hypothetical protein